MSEKKAPEFREYDVRIRERNLARGIVTDKELESYLTGLEDTSGNADQVTIAQPAFGGREDH